VGYSPGIFIILIVVATTVTVPADVPSKSGLLNASRVSIESLYVLPVSIFSSTFFYMVSKKKIHFLTD